MFDQIHFDLFCEILKFNVYRDILIFSETCHSGLLIINSEKFWSHLYSYNQCSKDWIIKDDNIHCINIARIDIDDLEIIFRYDASNIFGKVVDNDNSIVDVNIFARRCIDYNKNRILSVTLDKFPSYSRDVEYGANLLKYYYTGSRDAKCRDVIINKSKFHIDHSLLLCLINLNGHDIYDSPNLDIHYNNGSLIKILSRLPVYFDKNSIMIRLYHNPNFNLRLFNRQWIVDPEVRNFIDNIPEIPTNTAY